MSKKITSVPAAARTFNALRDLGYDLNSAVADVIDNSISRGKAKNIAIYFIKNKQGQFSLRIVDDGRGMTEKRLEEAMRLGSANEDYEEGDLSKYGMGMKTASLSQCHKLSVLSKVVGKTVTGYQWDMHHVTNSNEWELFHLNSAETKSILVQCEKELKSPPLPVSSLFKAKSWTAVLWDDLSEFQKDYDSHNSTVTGDNYYYRTSDKLILYLRMVFGRFLNGEKGARKTVIYFNGKKLTAFDPFCRKEKHTLKVKLSDKNGQFKIDKKRPPIAIECFILPSKVGPSKFSSEEAWSEAKGILSWNDAQGYYVYRNNRLITFGGWFGTKAKDEHDKLARVSIDVTEGHDDLFTLDVKKTKIQFPELLKNHLVDHVNKGFIKEAKRRYDGGERKTKPIINNVRDRNQKVNNLSSHLIRRDNISVTPDNSGKSLIIKNQSGKTAVNDITYKSLQSGIKFITADLKNDSCFWKMVPNPNDGFQVLINRNHPFYFEVYGNHEKDKKVTAIMDAFLFTMSFVELKCITKNNELLFEQMREVASLVLKKFIDDKIL